MRAPAELKQFRMVTESVALYVKVSGLADQGCRGKPSTLEDLIFLGTRALGILLRIPTVRARYQLAIVILPSVDTVPLSQCRSCASGRGIASGNRHVRELLQRR